MEQVQVTGELGRKTAHGLRRFSSGNALDVETVHSFGTAPAEMLWIAVRIVFGAVFLIDGILKWVLMSQGALSSAVLGMYFSTPAMASQSLLLGILVGLGETFGGLFLMLGIFQRPAALWSSAIMLAIYVMGGFDSWYTGFSGKVDLGGDLSLSLVYIMLTLVVPLRFGLSSHFHLPERIAPKDTSFHRLVRALVA